MDIMRLAPELTVDSENQSQKNHKITKITRDFEGKAKCYLFIILIVLCNC